MIIVVFSILSIREYLQNHEYKYYNAPYTNCSYLVNRLCIYERGTGDPIVLFPYPHSGAMKSIVYSDLFSMLVSMGRRVITFDTPGTFSSFRKSEPSIDEMADSAFEAIKFAGVNGKIDIIGHSMGGLCAIAFVLKYPNITGEKLILINSLSGFRSSLKWGMPGSAWKWYSKGFWKLALWGLRLKLGFGNHFDHNQLMNLIFAVSFHNKSYFEPFPIVPEFKKLRIPSRFQWADSIWNVDFSQRLKEIRTKTLITGSKFDPQTPFPCVKELHDNIPHSQLYMFNNSGHCPFIEEKYLFTQVLRNFLGK